MIEAIRSRLPPDRDLLPIGVLVAVGAALRVFLSFVSTPATLTQYDANSYVWQAEGGLFESFFQAPGYSFFLRIPHLLSDDVVFTLSVQHLLALCTAVLAWHVLYRLTSSRWAGLVPAAFLLLEADTLLVEHALMSETLFTLLVVAMIWAALGALGSERPLRWLLAAGLLLGAAIWVRYAAVALVPILLGWAIAVAWPRWRDGLADAAITAVPVASLIALLIVLQGAQNGHYGLGESGGWALYSRVAPFADCREFTPPEGTEALCQSTPSSERPHPDWYGYNQRSPAKIVFGGQPAGDELLGAWARRAILSQPLDYLGAVWNDLMLFFDEQPWTNRRDSLIGPMSVSFRLRTPDEHCPDCVMPDQLIEFNSLYGWTDPREGAYYEVFDPQIREGIEFFQDYQRVLRLHGPLFAVLVVLSLVGLAATRGPHARVQWLLTLCALALLVLPVATTTYNVRYGLPAMPIFALAATLAVISMRDRARRRLDARQAPNGRSGKFRPPLGGPG